LRLTFQIRLSPNCDSPKKPSLCGVGPWNIQEVPNGKFGPDYIIIRTAGSKQSCYISTITIVANGQVGLSFNNLKGKA